MLLVVFLFLLLPSVLSSFISHSTHAPSLCVPGLHWCYMSLDHTRQSHRPPWIFSRSELRAPHCVSLDYLVGSLPLPIADVSTPLVEKWRLRRGEGNGMVQASSCGGEGKRGGLHCTGQARPALPTRSVLTQFSVWLVGLK